MIRLWLGLAVSIVFLVLLAWQFDLAPALAQLQHARPGWLLLALLVLGVDFSLRISRWKLLLHHFNPDLGWRQAAGPFMGSFALNNVVPLRAGDIARAFAFRQQLGCDSGLVTSSLVIERVLDMAALLAFLLLGLALVSNGELNWVNPASYGLLLLVLASVMLVILAPGWWRSRLEGLQFARSAPGEFVLQVLRGLEQYRGTWLWIRLIGLSLLVWALEGCVYLLTCIALGAGTHGGSAWLAMSVGSLSTLLPSSPGYVGTFDYFATLTFSSTGMPEAQAVSVTLLVHLVLWLPITLLGGLYLLRHWGGSFRRQLRQLLEKQV